MVLLVRILFFVGILLLAFYWLRYLLHPKRKLELAHEKGNTYFLDEQKNVRKNFLITYKSVLFEGEKYLGTTEKAFVVKQIFIWTHTPSKLKGFKKEDFHVIEQLVRKQYPEADIDWKSPIKEFLKNEQ